MRRRRNLFKCIMGVVVMTLLFVGIWSAAWTQATKANKVSVTNKNVMPRGGFDPVVKPLSPLLDALTSVIELDGDIADNPAGAPDDWNTLNCDGGTAVVKTGVVFDGLGHSIFTGGGSKDPELLGSWKHKDGSVPDKDELINAYAAKYVSAGGDDILAFGADRYSNDGTSFMGFWFFRNPVFPAADGKFREGPLATDTLATHSLGDVLVLIEFTNGGAIATAKVFEWVGTGGSESGGTLQDITATAPPGSVLSVSNASAQTIAGGCPAWVHTPKTGPAQTIQINAFFEGAINLDAFPALQGACFSSFLAETRSAASVTATLKDFVLGTFNTCASIEVSKTADNTAVCAGATTTYTYVVHNTSGVQETVTLVDDNETPANAADDIDVPTCMPLSALPLGKPSEFQLAANDGAAGGPDQASYQCSRSLAVGSHTNVVTATGKFGVSTATATDNETVVVSPNPTANAGVDQSVCDTSPHQFTMAATAGTVPGGSITWSVVSNTTGQSVGISNTGVEDPTVTLNGFGTVELKMLVSNPNTGPSCVNAQDNVILTLSQNPAAAAGADKQACETTASHAFSLSDATSTVPAGGTRTWSVTANTTGAAVLISNVNAANPTVTLQGFGKATLTLTITNPATGTGCTGASDSVDLTLDQNPVITIQDVACTSSTGGTELVLTATVGAGGPGSTFSWSGPAGGIVGASNQASVTVNKAGLYTVTITNGASCQSVKSKQVGLCASDPPPAP